VQEFLGAAVIIITSERLVRVDDRKSGSAGGNCEDDGNQYEDFFQGPILSKKVI
jgi:hypothetical protein